MTHLSNIITVLILKCGCKNCLYISGISCTEDSCADLEEKCIRNSDCCTHKCSFSITSFSSHCKHSTNMIDSVRSYFVAKGIH